MNKSKTYMEKNILQIQKDIEIWLSFELNNNQKSKKPFSQKKLNKLLKDLLKLLEMGVVRVVNTKEKNYIVKEWVKKAILLYFKYAKLRRWHENSITYLDKFKYRGSDGNFRLLPGAVLREGAYIGKGAVVMPPSFINVGAYIDEKSMIDSLALIGSCAQIGKNCHISAGTIIGGVLEPAVARPVIVEDNVFVGGNCGIYEGVIVKTGAVIGTGTIINGSTPIIDISSGKIYRKEVPENAVVIPGGRKKIIENSEYYIQVPLIIKYRQDLKDPSKVDLNDILHDF